MVGISTILTGGDEGSFLQFLIFSLGWPALELVTVLHRVLHPHEANLGHALESNALLLGIGSSDLGRGQFRLIFKPDYSNHVGVLAYSWV